MATPHSYQKLNRTHGLYCPALVLGFLIPWVVHRILGTKLVTVSVNSDTAILSSMAAGKTALTGITFGDKTRATFY